MPQTTQFQGARLIPCLVYHDADQAIIWLERTFVFYRFAAGRRRALYGAQPGNAYLELRRLRPMGLTGA